jgi:predicted N-acyltransferase
MYTRIYHSVTEVGKVKWNSIVGRNRILCSYEFLLAIEKSNINDCKYFYPVIYNNDRIIAHACVYSITTDLDTLTSGLIKKLILFVRLFWKNFLKIKFLECGTPIALGNTISFSDSIDKKKAMNLLVDCMENIAKTKKIHILLLRDFYEDETSIFNNLMGRRYKKVFNLPNNILKVHWHSFDEYLNDLRSHYRYKIKKNIELAQKKNLKVEVVDDFSKISRDLLTLWTNVYNNAKEYKREIVTREFFVNLNTYLPNKAKVILLKNDSKIIGSALLLSDDDTLKFMYSGIDYKYNKEYSTYFNSLYYIVHQAITEEKKEIDLGISTNIPKMNIGAKMVDLYMYMKYMNKVLNPIITNLFNIMNPKTKITPNNVFNEKTENKFAKNYSIMHN